jgi:hypothetical protein
MFKTCIECNQKKSITDFRKRKNSKDGYNHSCQPCQLEKDRNYYSQNSTKEKRQKSYLARAKGIKDKQGNLTYKDPESPNYHAVRVIWS